MGKIDFSRSKDEIYKANMIMFADLFVSVFLNLNYELTRFIQNEIWHNYNVNYMDDFFYVITKELKGCKTLNDYNTLL